MTKQQIKQFSDKHSIDYLSPTGDGVHSFEGGFFFSDEDIALDLKDDIPVGLIELYMSDATSGHVTDFKTWLKDHKYF